MRIAIRREISSSSPRPTACIASQKRRWPSTLALILVNRPAAVVFHQSAKASFEQGATSRCSAANCNVFATLVDALVPRRISGFRAGAEGELVVDLGRPPLEYADECVTALLAEREMRERHPTSVAGTGAYGTALYVPAAGQPGTRTLDVRFQLAVASKVPQEEPIDIGAPAEADLIDVPVAELREIAVRLDAVFGQAYRAESVDRVFGHLRSGDGKETGQCWSLRAGPTRIFQAPTGVGKNVIAELLACWCASRGMVTSLVLPANAAVVSTAHALEYSLQVLGVDGDVVPLTSPDSAQKVAETTALGSGPAGLGLWAVERLSYGCALPSAAIAEESADTWEPGSEPCTSLRRVGADGRASGSRYACPWRPSCGKYRNARAATSAMIVVTSHVNWAVLGPHVAQARELADAADHTWRAGWRLCGHSGSHKRHPRAWVGQSRM